MIDSRVSIKDEKFLRLALNLARRNVGLTGRNPSVGCVITSGDIILGRGNTQLDGRPHAEVVAIKQASDHYLYKKNKRIKDINIYVTLEPCAHERDDALRAQLRHLQPFEGAVDLREAQQAVVVMVEELEGVEYLVARAKAFEAWLSDAGLA